jgi:pimeloyl-ACP methyl ester carboxylesterase
MSRSQDTQNLMDKSSQSQQERVADAFLTSHAEELKKQFSTSENLESLFDDVFGNNLTSSEELVDLRDKFVSGTLRPEVKFVSPQVLTDAQGRTRNAAFDRESQTILLSENLDAAGIKSSIQQELGHWWDVQLNGTKDTTTAEGTPFDEGTAYAERFAEGTKGDNLFSDVVYQNDSHTVFLNGRETSVEFRPIATWNINGATNSGNNTWGNVFDAMENPGQGQAPIEVMGIQEAGQSLGIRLAEIGDVERLDTQDPLIVKYNFTRPGDDGSYQIYWARGGFGGFDKNLAIVLRNQSENTQPIRIENPNNAPFNPGGNGRPALGVEVDGKYYFTVHAKAGFGGDTNVNNDAEQLLNAIQNNQNVDPEQPLYILGDFNRNVATANDPVGNVNVAFPEFNDQFAPPDDKTFSARTGNPNSTLDYLFTSQALQNQQGTVLNQLPGANTNQFPSDHFPVVYDDTVRVTAITDGGNENIRSTFFTFQDISQGTDVREFAPASDIDPNLPTYIVTHGFTDGVNSGTEWQKRIGEAILQQQDANIILVDWDAPGFDPNISPANLTTLSLTNYEQSAKNTEVIGARIAELISSSNINPANTTLIGHSLGAQASGWAGQKFQELRPGAKINNIVGLDPARPGFQESLNSEFYLDYVPVGIFDVFGVPVNIGGSGILGNYVSSHQLNADDANRVTAIHTSQRFGITNPITGAEGTENPNTLDIYINGGSYLGLFSDPIGTKSHNYSHEFFQYLLEGEGFNQDRNQVTGSQPLSNLKSPTGGPIEFPLVSLNTILQGNATPGGINQGIVDIKIAGSDRSAQVATIPDDLLFEATDVNDTLAGTNKSEVVVGKGGDDILSGLQGDDVMSGDGGNDLLFGGDGNDALAGGDGSGDYLVGGAGSDVLNGSAGSENDYLVGIDPRAGIAGVGEVDTLIGGDGIDTFILGDASGEFYGLNGSAVTIENFGVGQDLIQVSNVALLSFDVTSLAGVEVTNIRTGAQLIGSVIGVAPSDVTSSLLMAGA